MELNYLVVVNFVFVLVLIFASYVMSERIRKLEGKVFLLSVEKGGKRK